MTKYIMFIASFGLLLAALLLIPAQKVSAQQTYQVCFDVTRASVHNPRAADRDGKPDLYPHVWVNGQSRFFGWGLLFGQYSVVPNGQWRGCFPINSWNNQIYLSLIDHDGPMIPHNDFTVSDVMDIHPLASEKGIPMHIFPHPYWVEGGKHCYFENFGYGTWNRGVCTLDTPNHQFFRSYTGDDGSMGFKVWLRVQR